MFLKKGGEGHKVVKKFFNDAGGIKSTFFERNLDIDKVSSAFSHNPIIL